MLRVQVNVTLASGPAGVVAGATEPVHPIGNFVAGADAFFAPLFPDEEQPFFAFLFTLIGAEMYSPTVVVSPPIVNAVTAGSPPMNRKTCSGSLEPPAQGLDPSLMLCVTFVPAAISWVQGGPTMPFRVGGPLSTRVSPPHVVGMAVAD